MEFLFSYKNRNNTYSDIWARDADHAMMLARNAKDLPRSFFTIYRVTNVPGRPVKPDEDDPIAGWAAEQMDESD